MSARHRDESAFTRSADRNRERIEALAWAATITTNRTTTELIVFPLGRRTPFGDGTNTDTAPTRRYL